MSAEFLARAHTIQPSAKRVLVVPRGGLPGVFAAGDVRHGSVKRVASAVGEGSIATTQVTQYLQKQAQLS